MRTKDIEMSPAVADLALDKIAETGSGREVAGGTVVAEVGHVDEMALLQRRLVVGCCRSLGRCGWCE